MESKLTNVLNLRRVVLILPAVLFLLFLYFVVTPAISGV